MARTSAALGDRAFFINAADNEFPTSSRRRRRAGLRGVRRVPLRPGVVDAIERVSHRHRGGHADVPLDDVTIHRATVVA